MSRKPVDVHSLRDAEVRAVAVMLRRLVQLVPDAVTNATERTVAGAFERELQLQEEIQRRNDVYESAREPEVKS